ncbi:hypothetical protein [Mesorhizobium sp.]|uniref:hypothetical protein n=1 Tax=Mesorhizobium sp. TaxID=1871066 RepID=UPI0025C1CA57|nr:hypothetical protein [Mesorhizobium sp.]
MADDKFYLDHPELRPPGWKHTKAAQEAALESIERIAAELAARAEAARKARKKQ